MQRNRSHFTLAIIVVLAGMFAGCFRMQLDTKGVQEPIYLSSKTPKEYTHLKTFELETNGSWFFFGLGEIKKPEISQLIKDEIASQQGDAVINLTIRSQTTFKDGFMTVISLLGLFYSPRTVIVSGTVIAFNKESNIQPSESIRLEEKQDDRFTVYSTDRLVNEKTKIIF